MLAQALASAHARLRQNPPKRQWHMKLTTLEFAYIRSQRLYIAENCDGCGTLLNQTVRFTISGKLQRFHEPLRSRLNLRVFPSPEALRAAMAEFIE